MSIFKCRYQFLNIFTPFISATRNREQKQSIFLYTETYNGAYKVNGKIFSVAFTIGVSRFHNTKKTKDEIKGGLYHFRLINIKKLLPHPEHNSSPKQRQQSCENAIKKLLPPMGKLIPGIHSGSRINEKSIKNWEKAKKHIINLGTPKHTDIIYHNILKSQIKIGFLRR